MFILAGLFLRLALWQYETAQEQKTLAGVAKAAITEAPKRLSQVLPRVGKKHLPTYVHVKAVGRYDGRRQVVLTEIPRPGGGTVGGYVMTPFITNRGYLILVNRGWVPINSKGKVEKALEINNKLVTIVGYLAPLPRPGIRLGHNPSQSGWPKYYLYPRWSHLARLYGPAMLNRIILLSPNATNGYFRRWSLKPQHGPYRNYGYMVQWLALAAAVLITWFVLAIRYLKVRERDKNS